MFALRVLLSTSAIILVRILDLLQRRVDLHSFNPLFQVADMYIVSFYDYRAKFWATIEDASSPPLAHTTDLVIYSAENLSLQLYYGTTPWATRHKYYAELERELELVYSLPVTCTDLIVYNAEALALALYTDAPLATRNEFYDAICLISGNSFLEAAPVEICPVPGSDVIVSVPILVPTDPVVAKVTLGLSHGRSPFVLVFYKIASELCGIYQRFVAKTRRAFSLLASSATLGLNSTCSLMIWIRTLICNCISRIVSFVTQLLGPQASMRKTTVEKRASNKSTTSKKFGTSAAMSRKSAPLDRCGISGLLVSGAYYPLECQILWGHTLPVDFCGNLVYS